MFLFHVRVCVCVCTRVFVCVRVRAPVCVCSFFLRLCSEVPLLEDTLMRILVIGLSRDLPLGPADAMELADHLVKRAAGVQSDGTPTAPR